MNEIKESVRQLVKTIKNSQEYLDFLEAQRELDKDPIKKVEVNNYRTRIFEIQNTYSGPQLYQNLDVMYEESALFRRDPVINDFLNKELALCRVVQNVELSIVADLNFEIEFPDQEEVESTEIKES